MTDPRSLQLKAMKGNDLKILVALALLGAVNVGNKAIKQFCGLHYTTISNCLDNLAGMDMVTKTHRINGWQLTQGGRQMLLPTEPSHINCDSEPIINIDTPLTTLRIKDSNNNTSDPSAKICDSEILDALHAIGIYDPKAVYLACLDHMTLDYIASWKLALESTLVGKGGNDIPLAIHMMGQNAPAPEPKEKDNWKKYMEGEYSEFIEH